MSVRYTKKGWLLYANNFKAWNNFKKLGFYIPKNDNKCLTDG